MRASKPYSNHIHNTLHYPVPIISAQINLTLNIGLNYNPIANKRSDSNLAGVHRRLNAKQSQSRVGEKEGERKKMAGNKQFRSEW